jgi:hypothetical protein
MIYAPNHDLIVWEGDKGNFGDDYNLAMQQAFHSHDEIIIANDDVVLNKDTMRLLLEDVDALKKTVKKLGMVSVTSDNVRPFQRLSYRQQYGINHCFKVATLSPIFTWISKAVFKEVKFPPINWYGDDIMCLDLIARGYEHYISRAYVHHAGSMTIGNDTDKLTKESKTWIIANRPQYIKPLFG